MAKLKLDDKVSLIKSLSKTKVAILKIEKAENVKRLTLLHDDILKRIDNGNVDNTLIEAVAKIDTVTKTILEKDKLRRKTLLSMTKMFKTIYDTFVSIKLKVSEDKDKIRFRIKDDNFLELSYAKINYCDMNIAIKIEDDNPFIEWLRQSGSAVLTVEQINIIRKFVTKPGVNISYVIESIVTRDKSITMKYSLTNAGKHVETSSIIMKATTSSTYDNFENRIKEFHKTKTVKGDITTYMNANSVSLKLYEVKGDIVDTPPKTGKGVRIIEIPRARILLQNKDPQSTYTIEYSVREKAKMRTILLTCESTYGIIQQVLNVI